jgi:hypothetical protein
MTLTARHSRVRGLDHHHLSASPQPILDKSVFRRRYCSVSGFTRHARLAEETRSEIFNSDDIVFEHDLARPHPRVILSPTRDLLMELRYPEFGFLVST